jgi:hypothetical protein
MANRLRNYVFTEAELQRVLGGKFPDQFIKDYIAGKANAEALLATIDANTADIEGIQLQLTAINGQITVINGQIVTLQTDVSAVTSSLNSHIAAQSAHGATGDIVGTLDYCTATVGGVVLLATAVGDAAETTTLPPSAVAAAPAAYNQTYAQSQTDAINALINNITDLANALNSAVDVINSSLVTERTAKQRAT